MNKNNIKAYANRISNATRSELIVIMYDITVDYIEDAMRCYEQGNMEEYTYNLKKAKQFINELNSALDMRYTVSSHLAMLYSYMSRSLLYSIIKHEPKDLSRLIGMIKKLRTAFERVAKSDTTGPMMKNAQPLYAGLTYGKTSLNETMASSNNRGYKV